MKSARHTIAAIATPAGSGGIGIIRISGPKAQSILKRVFAPQNEKSKPTPYLLRFGKIISPENGNSLDEAMAVFFPRPHSFTGEDMVEIYCHAGHFSLKDILDNILMCDCQIAEPGEFSLRRFLNHSVDLTKLEGAAEIVNAKTELASQLIRNHLIGTYGEHVAALRQQIIHLLAEIEADIDFPEEESAVSINAQLWQEQLDRIISELEKLSASYRVGKIVRDGFRVIIAGAPNAGKSSLFNQLVKDTRALVTSIPGTTRDYISEWIDIEGLPVELYDTAGWRQGRGKIERAGIEKTKKLIQRADLVVCVIDLTKKKSTPPSLPLGKEQKLIIALNKADLLSLTSKKIVEWRETLGADKKYCVVSAKTGRGVAELLRMIYQSAGLADLADSLVVTAHRHQVKINKCLTHLKRVGNMKKVPAEIISFELRQAVNQISEITGHIYTEQILDEIFSQFCIGK